MPHTPALANPQQPCSSTPLPGVWGSFYAPGPTWGVSRACSFPQRTPAVSFSSKASNTSPSLLPLTQMSQLLAASALKILPPTTSLSRWQRAQNSSPASARNKGSRFCASSIICQLPLNLFSPAGLLISTQVKQNRAPWRPLASSARSLWSKKYPRGIKVAGVDRLVVRNRKQI